MTVHNNPTHSLAASYGGALQAAHDAAGHQHYPQGALYVVATPIGNLADITLRALHVLALADTIACEDTRHTQTLLRAYGISKTHAQLLALHQHNEVEAAQLVADLLRAGQRVAYTSDAGTPGISDPGARLVAYLQTLGLRTIPLPGASSITTLISASGVSKSQASGFVFAGFLPHKPAERAAAVLHWSQSLQPVVLLEAPHRMESLALALSPLGARTVTLGRELTKQFEEIVQVAATDLPAWLAADSNRLRGEFALLIHPAESPAQTTQDNRVLALLLAELPLKTAVKLAADITGESKNALYARALELKTDHPEA